MTTETLTILNAARSMPNATLDIETNDGHFFYTYDEATEAWDDLAPGEPFFIHAIRFDLSDPAERN